MRVGKWHILGPKSHVSIASLVGKILAVGMEPNFAVFAIVCHIVTTISPWGKEPSQEEGAIIVAYDKGLNAIEVCICSFGSSGVIQLLVRSMIPPVAPHAAFCLVRVVISSVNSKQPVRQRAKPQGVGPKAISRVVNQGLP